MPFPDHPSSASHTSSGFSNRIGWGQSPALVLIDVCQAYWTEGSPLDTSANQSSVASIDVMKQLLAAARASSTTPVIWTKVEYNDMSEAGLFYLKAKALDVWLKGDARGYDAWVQGLVPAEEEVVIAKKYASAFFGTDLATKLRILGVDNVVICGVSTSGCVRATSLDAMQNGFRPMVSRTCSSLLLPEYLVTLRRLWGVLAVIEHKPCTMRIYLI